MQWKILVLAALIVITIGYSIALHQSLQAYERWKESQIQQALASAWPMTPSIIRIDSYIQTYEGGLAIILGAALAVSWMVLVRRCLNLRLERQKFETD